MPTALFTPLWAQTTLSGAIRDGTGQPLPFVGVSLLDARDPNLAMPLASNGEGLISFEPIRAGQYLVRAMAAGYRQAHSVVVASYPIAVSALVLTEIKVMAKKPLVEQPLNQMVVNMAKVLQAAAAPRPKSWKSCRAN